MKSARIIADNGDVVEVTVTDDEAIRVVLTADGSTPVDRVVLDEIATSVLSDALSESRRDAVMRATARRNGRLL